MNQAEYDAFAKHMAEICLKRRDTMKKSLSNLMKNAECIMLVNSSASRQSARNMSEEAEILFSEMDGHAHYVEGVRDVFRNIAQRYNLKNSPYLP